MPDNPKSHFYQIHLSTVVLVVFIGGALVGLNLRKPHLDFAVSESPDATPGQFDQRGFPMRAYVAYWMYDCMDRRWIVADEHYVPSGIACDCIAALAILSVVAVGCEAMIRRRERLLGKDESIGAA